MLISFSTSLAHGVALNFFVVVQFGMLDETYAPTQGGGSDVRMLALAAHAQNRAQPLPETPLPCWHRAARRLSV